MIIYSPLFESTTGAGLAAASVLAMMIESVFCLLAVLVVYLLTCLNSVVVAVSIEVQWVRSNALHVYIN